MEKNHYCVYLHRRKDNNDIIYVGEGTESRARKINKSANRNKAYNELLDSTELYSEIYKRGLTKNESQELEEILIAKFRGEGQPLTNYHYRSYGALAYFKHEYSDKFIIDPTSPSGLRWREDRYLNSENGHKLANKGDVAGGLNPISGYWTYMSKMCHRIVYAIAHGECPAIITVDHIDGNKNNNSTDNLQLLSREDNTRKATKERNWLKGENSPLSKCTEEQVLEIYEMFKEGKSNLHIAKVFKVSSGHISSIRHGRKWKDLFIQLNCIKEDNFLKSVVTVQQVKDAIILLAEGKSNKEISETTSIKDKTVSKLRLGTGLKRIVKLINQQKGINEYTPTQLC